MPDLLDPKLTDGNTGQPNPSAPGDPKTPEKTDPLAAAAEAERRREQQERNREIERSLERDSLFQKGLSGDTNALRQSLRLYGLSDKQIDIFLFGQEDPTPGRPTPRSRDSAQDGDESDEILALREEISELQRTVAELAGRAKNHDAAQESQARLNEINLAIDKDEELSKLLSMYSDPAARDTCRRIIQRTVIDTARSREYKDRVWGATVIRAGLEQARRLLKTLNVSPRPASQENDELGLSGIDSTTAGLLGLPIPRPGMPVSPEDSRAALERLTKKRVEPGQDGREEYLAARLIALSMVD